MRKPNCRLVFGLLIAGILSAVSLPALAGKGEKMKNYFANMDSNGDGSVSQEEFMESKTQKARERFQAMDQNGDGALTMQEMKMSRKAMKEERKAGKEKY